MTTKAKLSKRVTSEFVFFYGPYQIRVNDGPRQLDVAQARAIAADAHEATGAHCTRCRSAALVRTIICDAPNDALCADCAGVDYSAAFATTTR